ncbi:MAG: hypothetical protein ACT4O9_11255 [Blastocatellia bacterium]
MAYADSANRVVKGSVVLAAVIFCAFSIYGQTDKADIKKDIEPPVTLADVLRKLTFTSRIQKPTNKINENLIVQIKKRSVDFALNDEIIKQVKEAGGSELLLTAIEDALPKEKKERLREIYRLEIIVRENYARTSTLHLAIKAGRELIDKYSDDYGAPTLLAGLKLKCQNDTPAYAL